MVYYELPVLDRIHEFVTYVISNGLCSSTRAKEKMQALMLHLQRLDKGICMDKPSTHRSFGKKEGYLYGFFKDRKSKTQWNYLYERFEDNGNINVIVHDLCCGGLKDSFQFSSLCDMLCEVCREDILYNLLTETLYPYK